MGKSKNKKTSSGNVESSSKLKKSTIFHLIALSQYLVGIVYDHFYVEFPAPATRVPALLEPNFGGKYKFLTYWTLIFQAVYFTLAVINDFFGTNEVAPKKLPAVRKLRDYIFAAFAFPLAFTVAVSFWSIYAVDRELILPKAFDAFFPTWLNHIMHTNIAVFIVLEMFITFRQYPPRKIGLTMILTFMASYVIWLHVIRYIAGIWVYPILEVLNLPQRIGFYVANALFCVSLYYIGEKLNSFIWSSELRQIKPIKSKKK